MREEYRVLSSITNGINETYKTYEETKERYEFIKNNKEDFKKNSMIYFYINYRNEEDKIIKHKNLGIIDFNK